MPMHCSEVKLDDARAIVQNSVSWGALLTDGRKGAGAIEPPVFCLYSKHRRRQMEDLVRKGVQMTLEGDPEQRAMVDRQKQQRIAIESGSLLANGAPPMMRRMSMTGSQLQLPLLPAKSIRKITFQMREDSSSPKLASNNEDSAE